MFYCNAHCVNRFAEIFLRKIYFTSHCIKKFTFSGYKKKRHSTHLRVLSLLLSVVLIRIGTPDLALPSFPRLHNPPGNAKLSDGISTEHRTLADSAPSV